MRREVEIKERNEMDARKKGCKGKENEMSVKMMMMMIVMLCVHAPEEPRKKR